MDYFNNTKCRVGFNGSCWKADGVNFAPNEAIDLDITSEIKSR